MNKTITNNIKRTLLLLATLSLLSSCNEVKEEAREGAIPQWLIHTPTETNKLIYAVAKQAYEGDSPTTTQLTLEASNNLQEIMRNRREEKETSVSHDENTRFGRLERDVRNKIRAELTPIAQQKATKMDTYIDKKNALVYVLVAFDKQQRGVSITKRLAKLDQQLLNHIHVSQKGSHFNQLLAISPFLPIILERQTLIADYKLETNQHYTSKNDPLAAMADAHITRLFNKLVFSISAMSTESEVFESSFVTALNDAGLHVSSRRPDLIFSYYIESEESVAGYKNTLIDMMNEIEVINRDSTTFSTYSSETQGNGPDLPAATTVAMNELAVGLVDMIVEKLMTYMNDVNRLNYQH